jgi:hypothetical protein
MYECPSRLRESKGNDMNRPIRRLGRAIKEVWFGRSRVRDEEGLSIWIVLGGLLLSALLVSLFIIPNLLGARAAALNGAAEHNLQASLTSVKTYFDTNGSSFANISSAAMAAIEPTLTFTTTSQSSGPKNISIATNSGLGPGFVGISALSSTGACFIIWDVETQYPGGRSPGVYYNSLPPGMHYGCDVWYSASFRNGFPPLP